MLKSQINPHFLFNMLNNAIVLVKEGLPLAGDIIMKLREMPQLSIGAEPCKKRFHY